MAMDQDLVRRKNEELGQAIREKSRKLLQTQELYDKLKRRDMLGQVQNAASDAVEHTIEASVIASRFADMVNNQNQNQRPIPPPRFSGTQVGGLQYPSVGHGESLMAAPLNRTGNGHGTWAASHGQGSQGSSQRM